MSPIADPTQDIISLALFYGIQLNEQQASLLLQHLHLLQEKNKQINLTRIVSTKDGLLRHILDSLLFLLPLDSHDIAENVHHTIEENFKDVKHCMVHVNPVNE